MRRLSVLKYILPPALALAAGIKLGIKYATDHYVVKDKKFIEGEVIKEKK